MQARVGVQSGSRYSSINKGMTNPIHLTQDRMTEGRHNEAPALQPIPDARMLLFTQLKPYTSQLLRARDSPARLQGLLRSLQSVIRDADVDSLNSRGIFDYILFPLMPGVDSIVLVRRSGRWVHACCACLTCSVPIAYV